MSNTLVPDYLNIDYKTMRTRLFDLLSSNPIYKDYNIEGNNITILSELVSYINMLTMYHINKVAKNQYLSSSDIYETTHMLSRLRGYNPKGYISSSTYLTFTLGASTGISLYDALTIPAWVEIECNPDTGLNVKDSEGNNIRFSTIETTTVQVTAVPFSFSVPVRQGKVHTYTFTGIDLIDNKIYLPYLQFDYDDDLTNVYPCMEVKVDDVTWARVENFYDTISGLSIRDNIYMFKYNKYQNYVVEFSSSNNLPETYSTISITLLESLGENGNVSNNVVTKLPINFIYNTTKTSYLETGSGNNANYVITTHSSATGGLSPESIADIKINSVGSMYDQFRDVTSYDYVKFLEEKDNVIAANAWGQQSVTPSGSILEYNKVYISVIPDTWGTTTINKTTNADGSLTPTLYADEYKTDLAKYLEPRKVICIYEQYEVPDLVYFSFDIGIKPKRTYSFALVEEAVKNKLEYYFNYVNRSFNETIKLTDIIDYLMDTSKVSPTDNFTYIKGVQYIMFRDVNANIIYEPNTTGAVWAWGMNNTKQLGNNDINWADRSIPVLLADTDNFSKISTFCIYSIGLKEDGTAWAWGNNMFGQLGDGTVIDRISPVFVKGNISFSDISVGGMHSLGINGSDSSLWAWGDNTYGQFGNNTSGNSCSSPVLVSCSASLVQVIAGNTSSYGLDNNGEVWAWGANNYGQLANFTNIDTSIPSLILGGIQFSKISVGMDHIIGIRSSDGSLWAWGYNDKGQLGDGTTNSRSSPVAVLSTLSFKDVACGLGCSIGISEDNVYTWGMDIDIMAPPTLSPVATVMDVSFTNVAVCSNSVSFFGLDTEGAVWSWGWNAYGQLGNNSNDDIFDPVKIIDYGVTDVQAGDCFGMVLRNFIGFPKYTVDKITHNGYNKLRDIELGNNQFPQVLIDNCTFTEEG